MWLLWVVLAMALVLGTLWLGQRRLIYFPDSSAAGSVATAFPDGRDVTLRTADGVPLGAWFVPGRGRGSGPGSGLTVLVANGNGGNRAGRASLAAALSDLGFSVLLFDYRGYGGNPGSPSEAGLALDILAAYHYLVDEVGVVPGRLLCFGESLGSAVVTGLVTRLEPAQRPAGVLLRSPFVDLAAAGATRYPFLPVRAMLRDRFPVAEQVSTLDLPLAVVLGTADSVIPAEQSREVARRAPGSVTLTEVVGADHNDPELFSGDQLIDAVVDLAERVNAAER